MTPSHEIKRALITSVDCCLGSHLADLLAYPHYLGREIQVIGATQEQPMMIHLKCLKEQKNFHLIDPISWRDPEKVAGLIAKIRPDTIIFIPEPRLVGSFSELARPQGPNAIFQNICEAIRDNSLSRETMICVIGSYEQYGSAVERGRPITEQVHFQPTTLYAQLMCNLEQAAKDFRIKYSQKIIYLRVFNYTGPRREKEFADADFAYQIAKIKCGQSRYRFINVGNLDAVRDFTDARDVAWAIIRAIEAGLFSGAYNVCSGQGYQIGDILNRLIGLADVQISINQDDRRIRPGEPHIVIGSNEKLVQATDWQPRINYWGQTLPELFGHYMAFFQGKL